MYIVIYIYIYQRERYTQREMSNYDCSQRSKLLLDRRQLLAEFVELLGHPPLVLLELLHLACFLCCHFDIVINIMCI